jgi:tetratricopeptide (TPR) repeat protein
MRDRRVVLGIIILSVVILVVLIIKNPGFLTGKYEWYKAEKISEKRQKEIMEKFDKNKKLNSVEIGEIAAYFLLKQKYDEGIKKLKDIQSRQDNYAVYFNLSAMYAYKAMTLGPSDEKIRLVSISHDYLMKGFTKVPDKSLAYYLRGKAYGVLGCSEMAVEDFHKAIEESKAFKIILLGDDLYVARQKFVEIVEEDIVNYKQFKGNCLIEVRRQPRVGPE